MSIPYKQAYKQLIDKLAELGVPNTFNARARMADALISAYRIHGDEWMRQQFEDILRYTAASVVFE